MNIIWAAADGWHPPPWLGRRAWAATLNAITHEIYILSRKFQTARTPMYKSGWKLGPLQCMQFVSVYRALSICTKTVNFFFTYAVCVLHINVILWIRADCVVRLLVMIFRRIVPSGLCNNSEIFLYINFQWNQHAVEDPSEADGDFARPQAKIRHPCQNFFLER